MATKAVVSLVVVVLVWFGVEVDVVGVGASAEVGR